jgi:hypothetical protein
MTDVLMAAKDASCYSTQLKQSVHHEASLAAIKTSVISTIAKIALPASGLKLSA